MFFWYYIIEVVTFQRLNGFTVIFQELYTGGNDRKLLVWSPAELCADDVVIISSFLPSFSNYEKLPYNSPYVYHFGFNKECRKAVWSVQNLYKMNYARNINFDLLSLNRKILVWMENLLEEMRIIGAIKVKHLQDAIANRHSTALFCCLLVWVICWASIVFWTLKS